MEKLLEFSPNSSPGLLTPAHPLSAATSVILPLIGPSARFSGSPDNRKPLEAGNHGCTVEAS